VPELLVALIVVCGLCALLFTIRPIDYSLSKYQSEQRMEVAQIMQGIQRYRAAHNGSLPSDFPTVDTPIATVDGYDLCDILVPTYMKDLPIDSVNGIKTKGTALAKDSDRCDGDEILYGSGYFVVADKDGRVTVSAVDSTGSAEQEYKLKR